MTCTRPQAESQKNPLTRGRRPHMTYFDRHRVVGAGSVTLISAMAYIESRTPISAVPLLTLGITLMRPLIARADEVIE